jgi:hypothetical protein
MSLFLTHPDFRNSGEEFYLHETLSTPIKLLSSISSLIWCNISIINVHKTRMKSHWDWHYTKQYWLTLPWANPSHFVATLSTFGWPKNLSMQYVASFHLQVYGRVHQEIMQYLHASASFGTALAPRGGQPHHIWDWDANNILDNFGAMVKWCALYIYIYNAFFLGRSS